ncbi:glycerophosphodiester phosphodiesterase [Salinibaculum salinum]|uniref:glycerophosphodiester phosphodiesterase n=1 Tax=Salinibaculum salinum TaxID=3131996 RepID=UPI0030ED35CA
MRCFAHRGFAGVNPENTVQAVRAAVEAGADGVEVDVRRCGTGELVVFHDDELGRLTDATGIVGEASLSTLQTLSVLESDATIPTLAEMFEATPDHVALNVELKERGLAADCLTVVDRFANDVLVSSFDTRALRNVGERSDVPLALLFGSDTDTAIDVARRLDCESLHPYRRCCDAGFVDTAHGAGFEINTWTIQSDKQADRLAALGVDGLIADAPRFCRR